MLTLKLHHSETFNLFLMRYPQHLVLDHSFAIEKKSYNNWSTLYVKQIARDNQSKTPVKNVQLKLVNTKEENNLPFSGTTLFDINFLRKDKLYTKLKYSRCPQYDIVSGG